MKTKLVMLGAIMGVTACLSASGMAAGTDRGELNAADDQAVILKDFDRLYFEAPLAADLAVMNVRVYSPDNELLLSTRSVGEPVEFLLDSDLPDGTYRYEAVSIFGNMDLSDRSTAAKSVNEESFLLRKFGSFKVSDGQVSEAFGPDPRELQLQQQQATGRDDAALLDRVIRQAINLAGVTLDFLIPSAQAQDLTINDTSPSLLFDDTQDEDCTPLWDWSIDAQGGTSNGDTANTFIIAGWSENFGGGCPEGSVPIITLNNDGGEGANDSGDTLVVDSDGDIHWAQGGMNFDKGASALSLGTTAVRRDVTIASLDPAIDLFDETFSDSMGINYNGIDFSIYNNAGVDAVLVNFAAPANSLHIEGDGDVGLGTSAPNADLNVVAGNTAQIRVDNTTVSPAAGDQVMFQLQSAATNKVRFVIGNQNGLWTFDNAGGSFQINLAGTGVNEFRVESDGDAVILKNSFAVNHVNTSSRDSKTDFAPIDEIAILEKLSELPMSTWRYKIETEDERHLGPVAEDFQQAFGLSDGKHISTVDASGVALTAIKGLNKVLQERTAEIAELTQANSDLQKANFDLMSANRALDERLTRLENVLLHQNEVAVR